VGNLKYIGVSLAIALSLGISGCGGGGGSSSTGDTSGLSFPSNAVVAEPTLANGILVEDAVATNQTSGIPLLNSVDANSKFNVALLGNEVSSIIATHIKDTNINSYSLNETINETVNCSSGGSYSINGTGSDTAGGTLTMSFNQCNEGAGIINGSIYASISNYDANVDDYKDMSIKFTSDFTMTTGSTVAKISQNSYMNVNVLTFNYGSKATFKLAMSIQATDGTIYFGQKDSIYYFSTDGYNTQMYQTQGKVYINNLVSYVDYDTSYDMSQTPFVFNGSSITSGEARYKMSGSGKVKIIVQSNNPITYIDADGDGTYELSELM
jgi:hypothetical protein